MDKPIYQVVLNDEAEGILGISLVEHPAIELSWILLSQEEVQLSTYDEDKHLIEGVIIVPDKPILRRREDGSEYYITFSKDVIKQMAQRLLKEHTFNNIDTQHSGRLIEGVELMELYLKDENKGLQFNVPEGSLIATYKVEDQLLWERLKSGELTGFSLTGLFSIEEISQERDDKDELTELVGMLKRIRQVN